jgi:hypothetical protein
MSLDVWNTWDDSESQLCQDDELFYIPHEELCGPAEKRGIFRFQDEDESLSKYMLSQSDFF